MSNIKAEKEKLGSKKVRLDSLIGGCVGRGCKRWREGEKRITEKLIQIVTLNIYNTPKTETICGRTDCTEHTPTNITHKTHTHKHIQIVGVK